MPGIFGRPSALPFFAKQKAIIIVPPFYRKTAPLRKGSFGGNGVPRSEESSFGGSRHLFASVSPTVGRNAEKTLS